MRIIFITITFYPEPNAIHGLPLAKCLAKRGHEIKVLTAFPQYPMGRIFPGYKMRLWQREMIEGISVLRVPIYPSHDTNPIRRVFTYLSFALTALSIGTVLIGPADIVYLYDPPPTNGLAALILKFFKKIPVVHAIADMWPETVIESGMVKGERTKKIMTALIGVWCRFLYRQAAAMSVLSEGFKKLLMERGVAGEKIKVIYNWTDETNFKPLDPDAALAAELGFQGRFNIVYAGNLGVFQGMETIIRAAALVKHERRIRIVLVGIGPKEEELKRLATVLKLENVIFLGRRPYEVMPKINGLADVLLIHLKKHDFLKATIPGKVQVSMASGRPILMAVAGDAAELVRRAGAGMVCEPEDPEVMAKLMIDMAAMPKEALEAMGARGYRFYQKNFSLASAGEQLDEVLQKVVSERKAKRPGKTAATTKMHQDVVMQGLFHK